VHRIALFAARDILPYEELTYDYGCPRPLHEPRARRMGAATALAARSLVSYPLRACSRPTSRALGRYVVGSVKGKTLKCLCGAATCRGFLF
jgi:SET domain-containing protein